jgi:hypothetical protein
MTIKDLMARVAGDDLEWFDLDARMLRELGDVKVEMATLAGHDREGKTVLFRLPVEKLRKKP